MSLVLEEGSVSSKLTQEEDDTELIRVLHFKLTLHSIYDISNPKFLKKPKKSFKAPARQRSWLEH